MRLSTVLIFVLMIGSTVVSCFQGTCDPVPPFFQITGLNSFNLRFTNAGINPWEALAKDSAIDWKNFFVRFYFDKNYIGQLDIEPNGSLNALSCDPPGSAGDKIGVDTIFLVTLYDYNDEFLAGDTINPIILTNAWTYFVDDFDKFKPLNDYLLRNAVGVRQDQFEIKLNEAPITGKRFSMRVSYVLNNGEVFHDTTDPVTLQ